MFKKGTPATPSYRAIVRSHRSHHFFRNGLAVVALGLFATAAALAVVQPPEVPVVYEARQTLDLPSPFPQAQNNFSAPFIGQTLIRAGDTLAVLLQRLHVQEPGLLPFLIQNKNARSIYKLYPGRNLQAALDQDGNLAWLRYHHTPYAVEQGKPVSRWLEITPSDDGGFNATEHTEAASTQIRMAEGVIRNSLFGATDAANIPDAITMQMTEILGSKIDFIRDLRSDDRFRIVYETYSHNGHDVGSGRILALDFRNRDKTYEAVWFAPEGQTGSYYDFDGASLKGAFLRSALKFTRISSTFGMRKHPVHGVWRGHKGVDYAAQSGTPIHATADGVVEFKGKQRGYGNTIILKHHNGYSTLYAHQSRYAKGLKKGDKVSQGQLIGYVGSTGWATGPHLHYEFRVNNKPIDPLSVDLPVARTLDKSQRKAFDKTIALYQDHMNFLASMHSDDLQVAAR
ncbi:M23 family metallopeptidase [Pollutimonas harenae]|uniref:M23 family metallopeptidase n=1 Tax=Pollutimonas harenae TaxID=657015 RepID=A0A853H0F4_9BURK|nr:M23 family metallopeptidase [Pollutimonas harenae]NYT84053.1 M23 family metallopeptidase [Pollutimonas harenae]TEA73522.1 M23 family metallopeptidase [Pollutimonas harenae]